MGSPVPLMVAIGIYTGVMVLMGIGGANTIPDTPAFEKPVEIPVIGEILGVMEVVWDSIKFIVGVFTFNIPGIPGWIRLIMNIAVWGKMAWDIGGLIRGGK